MKLTLPNKLTRLDAHWEMLAITAVLFVLVAVFVDLKPVVDEIFSFPPAIPDSGNPRRSSNVSRRSRKLSWRCRPAIFLHRVTPEGQPARSTRIEELIPSGYIATDGSEAEVRVYMAPGAKTVVSITAM